MAPLSIHLYGGAPSPRQLMEENPFVSRTALPISSTIMLILRLRRVSQVYKPIIAFDRIDVVDLPGWPLSSHEKPRQSTTSIDNTSKLDLAITLPGHRSGDVSDLHSIRRTLLPPKLAGAQGVGQKLH